MEQLHAIITGVGGYVPDYILTNEELSHMVDTSDEWIMERIGVKTRHILRDKDKGTSYMAVKACQQLLARTHTDPQDIDMLIVATTTPDYHFPSTAALVTKELGLTKSFAFDVQAACSGFLYLLEIGANFVRTGRCKKVILCGAEKLSYMTDYTDRSTCPIFGDGAGAVLMEPTTEELGVMDSVLRCDGEGYPYLHMAAGGSACPPSHYTVDNRMHYIFQDGRPVFKAAVVDMAASSIEVAKRNHLEIDDIQWVIPHQANLRIISAVAKRMNVPMEKVLINIEKFGNTSGATLPLVLWDYEDKFQKGDNIIFTTFGAGFTWGAVYLKWAYDGRKRKQEEDK